MGQFTNLKNGCANVSSNNSRAEKVCGCRLVWWTPRVDSLKLSELAYTRIENAYKVHKKSFVLTVFTWLLYVQLLGGQNRYAFV